MENLTLAELVAWIESRGDLHAIRFEPSVYNKFSTPAKITRPAREIVARIASVNRCSAATAAMIYSSSWGMYQIMGFNVYAESSADMPIGEFLGSPRAQRACFDAFIRRAGLQHFTPGTLAAGHDARLKFAMGYNGSIAYEQAVVRALAHFGMTAIPPISEK